MSLNTAHASNGVLIHSGEYILLHSDSVSMDFSGQDNPAFKGSKQGRIYLTSHRMIFNNKKSDDAMQSFSAPFIAMSNVELEQPVFGANYIKGKVRAQPNGNFVGEVKFKLYFKAGGAIEYGSALLRAATTAQSNMRHGGFSDDPPPYTPSGAWHEAPPPAYQPPPGYYGWLPTHDAFSGPAPNTVFISDNPPPYPGIGGPPAYSAPAQPQQYPGYQPQPNGNPGWNAPPSGPPHQPWANHQAPPQSAPQNTPQSAPQSTPQTAPQDEPEEPPSWNGFSLPPDEPSQQRQQQPQQQSQQQQQSPPPQQQQWGGYQPPPFGAGGYGPPGAQPAPGYYPGYPGYPGYQGNPGYPGYPGYQGGCPPLPQGAYPYPPGGAAGGAAAGAMGFGAPPPTF